MIPQVNRNHWQAAEKYPSAAFALILPRVKHGAGLLQRTSKYASLLRISGAPVNGISQTQLASACLRVAPPCGANAGAFLSSLKKITFSASC